MKVPAHPFQIFPERTCTSCGQTSHGWERAYSGRKFVAVKWHKTQPCAAQKGKQMPIGRECYYCFDTRRRFYLDKNGEDIMPQKDLDELVNGDNVKAAEEHEAFRTDKVLGLGEYKHKERVTAQHYVLKTQKQFGSFYEEGSFEELLQYASSRSIQYKSIEHLKSYITKKLKLKIRKDPETGEEGVCVPDSKNGSTRRYRIGLEDSVAQVGHEAAPDEEVARERAADLCRASRGDFGAEEEEEDGIYVGEIEADEEKDEGGSDSDDAGPALSATGGSNCSTSYPRSPGAPSSAASTCSNRVGLRLPCPAPRRLRGDIGSQAPGSPPHGSRALFDAEEEDTVAADEGAGGRRPSKPQQAVDKLMADGRNLLAETEVKMSAEMLWNRQVRKRVFDDHILKITKKATKVSCKMDVPGAADLGEELTMLACRKTTERDFLAVELRDKPEDSVRDDLPAERIQILKSMAPKLVGNIVMTCAATICNYTANDDLILVLKMAVVVNPDPGNYLNCGFMRRCTESENQAFIAQKNIVALVVERTAKGMPLEEFGRFYGEEVATLLPKNVSVLAGSKLSTSSDGWARAVLVDLCALQVLGKAMLLKLKGVKKFPAEFAKRCSECLAVKDPPCTRNVTTIRF